jgi:hypothetical protein
MMTDHPSRGQRPAQLLVDLAEERLGLAEVEALEMMLTAEGLEAPPPWVLRRAERIVRQRSSARQRESWTGRARRFVAALTFDSQTQPQFVGLRASRTQVRRLLFQAENIEVDLEMSPSPASEQVRLAGQITAGGTDPSGGFLRLTTAAGEWRAQLDDTGEFWIDSLTPGTYRLEVVFSDQVIEVPVLPL